VTQAFQPAYVRVRSGETQGWTIEEVGGGAVGGGAVVRLGTPTAVDRARHSLAAAGARVDVR